MALNYIGYQGATVFGSNIIYAIGGPTYTNDWGARGFAGT